ncbi:MAG: hypothetical protein CM1200mP2_08460 [Planctomycetaceae bacterium]|nr:MAG: hypothetical protein CM1200mP2_08460 [Planctomycetaceae bacterium]
MSLTRRQLLTTAAATATSAAISSAADTPQSTPSPPPFRFCLNTSTIRGQKLTLLQEISLPGESGLHRHRTMDPGDRPVRPDGGSLKDLRKRITDAGLRVESAIGFAPKDCRRRQAASRGTGTGQA